MAALQLDQPSISSSFIGCLITKTRKCQVPLPPKLDQNKELELTRKCQVFSMQLPKYYKLSNTAIRN